MPTSDITEDRAVAVVVPAQLQTALPAISPLAREVAELLAEAPRNTRLTYGPLAALAQKIAPARIWVDPRLMVFGPADLDTLNEAGLRYLVTNVAPEAFTEGQETLLQAYEDRMVLGNMGQHLLHLLRPLIVIERVHPDDPNRDLLLLADPLSLFAAKALGWDFVEAIPFGDMPDLAVRSFGLHLKMRESPPSKFEIWRCVRGMEQDGWETKAGLARLLGISRAYASKLESTEAIAPEAIDAAMRGLVPIQLAMLTAAKLSTNVHLIPGALQHMASDHMSVSVGRAYLTKLAADANAALLLVSDQRRPDAGVTGVKMLISLMEQAQALLRSPAVAARFQAAHRKDMIETLTEYADFFAKHLS